MNSCFWLILILLCPNSCQWNNGRRWLNDNDCFKNMWGCGIDSGRRDNDRGCRRDNERRDNDRRDNDCGCKNSYNGERQGQYMPRTVDCRCNDK